MCALIDYVCELVMYEIIREVYLSEEYGEIVDLDKVLVPTLITQEIAPVCIHYASF